MNRTKDPIYLDHSATTPVEAKVVEAMAPYWSQTFGNTESSHAFGRAAASALEEARQTVAGILGCRRSEVVFTGSGTESDNLALRGAAWAARDGGQGNHILTTPIEHHAVGGTLAQLQDLFGFSVEQLPVDQHGLVNPADVASAIRPDTILVSVILANNEIGTIQPTEEIGPVCRERGILFHTDAVQAPGRLSLQSVVANADFVALSAHKFYGPKGVGLLFVRRNAPFIPPITGGDHERGRRPATVNVAGAVGLAKALQVAEEGRAAEGADLLVLRDALVEGILDSVPDALLTGHPRRRLPHHASFAFRGIEGESIVQGLDLAGIAASSGAACAEGEPEPSYVLKALGLPPEWGIGSLRLTLGRSNTKGHIDRLLNVLPRIIQNLREAR